MIWADSGRGNGKIPDDFGVDVARLQILGRAVLVKYLILPRLLLTWAMRRNPKDLTTVSLLKAAAIGWDAGGEAGGEAGQRQRAEGREMARPSPA